MSSTSGLRTAVLASFFFYCWLYLEFGRVISAGVVLLLYAATGGWKWLRVAALTVRRDAFGLRFVIWIARCTYWYKWRGYNVGTLFADVAKRRGNRVASMIEIEDGKIEKWTFQQMDEYSNRVAHYFISEGYRPGETVALYMTSRPEFIVIWLGLCRAGIKTALLNHNLRGDTLQHCLREGESRCVVVGQESIETTNELAGRHTQLILTSYSFLRPSSCEFDAAVKKMPSHFPLQTAKLFGFLDDFLYIYTSGTTGLPKAARISSNKFFYMAASQYYLQCLNPDKDIAYVTLPIYHSNGGILGVGACVLFGIPIAIRPKFSRTAFWKDCVKFNATMFFYIGEICRYLLTAPVTPEERQHRVRLMVGNGLRKDIWLKFQERFHVAKVGEFYGATEGNANLSNFVGHPGSVGFTSRIVPRGYPVILIKVDETSGAVVRDSRGMAVECSVGEKGELCGKITKSPLRQFQGYTNKEQTEKKILKDVLHRGDTWFRSGDILEMDELGFMYFSDRTGDTFRWKGENVSTSEVEMHVQEVIQLNDATVFGVEVANCEGKAGMVAIVDTTNTLNLTTLLEQLLLRLPRYAIPIFVRVASELPMTSTHKLTKGPLQKDGYNPSTLPAGDRIFYLNRNSYDVLTADVFANIERGSVQF